MNGREAARLAQRIGDAWPGRAGVETLNIYADRLVAWETGAAERAVEALIDTCRYLPSVAELRDAYRAAGGPLPDPGRRMSPPVEPIRVEQIPEAEQAAIIEVQQEIRRRLAEAQERRYGPRVDGER